MGKIIEQNICKFLIGIMIVILITMWTHVVEQNNIIVVQYSVIDKQFEIIETLEQYPCPEQQKFIQDHKFFDEDSSNYYLM